MAIPSRGRSECKLTAPFAPKNRFAGLTVEHLEVFDAEDQYWTKFQGTGKQQLSLRMDGVRPDFGVPDAVGRAGRRCRGPVPNRSASVGKRLRERLAADPKRVRIPLAKLSLHKSSWPR